jgi:hypothetical protein
LQRSILKLGIRLTVAQQQHTPEHCLKLRTRLRTLPWRCLPRPKNDFFLEVIFEFVDESSNTSSMRSMLRTVKCLWRHILCSTWLAAGCSKALTAGYLRVTLCCNDVHHGQWLSTCQSLWCFGTSAAIWLEIDSSNVLKNLSSRM